MSADINTLSREEALALLANDHVPSSGYPAHSLKTLNESNELYERMETILDERLALSTAHTFHLEKLEVVSASSSLSREFKRRLRKKSNIHLCFHGTTESNHTSIFNKGFLLNEKHYGDTDLGFIGKGIYFSPHPEYSAAYIKNTPGITRLRYKEPVKPGCTCKLLGCIVIVGVTKQVKEMLDGDDIEEHLDSHWTWVEKYQADITTDPSEYFAQEYAIREPQGAYPRFRLSLKRVTREVIWVDPNITNSENSDYVRQLKRANNMFVFATDSSATALAALKKRKKGTHYRAITAGRGGEDFVRNLRGAGLECRVLVFCDCVDYHKTWAKTYYRTKVTGVSSEMIKFAKWEDD